MPGHCCSMGVGFLFRNIPPNDLCLDHVPADVETTLEPQGGYSLTADHCLVSLPQTSPASFNFCCSVITFDEYVDCSILIFCDDGIRKVEIVNLFLEVIRADGATV